MNELQDHTDDRYIKGNEYLKQKVARLEKLLEEKSAYNYRLSFKPDGTIISVNEKLCNRIGKSTNKIQGSCFFDLYSPEDRFVIADRISRINRENAMEQVELRLQCSDSSLGWHEWVCDALFKDDGTLLQINALGKDVSGKMQDDITQMQPENFRALTENSVVGVYLIQNEIFRYVNPCLANLFGYTTGELIGIKGPKHLVPEEDWVLVSANINKRIRGEANSIRYNFKGITKHGKTIFVEVFGSKILYRGEPAIVGTLLDITERKKSEKVLKESELRYRNLIENFEGAIYSFDEKGTLLFANTAAASKIGLGEQNPIGKKLWDIFPKQMADLNFESIKKVIQTGKGEILEEKTTVNGKTRFFRNSLQPSTDSQGTFSSVIVISIDISGRYEAEEALRNSENRFRTFVNQSSEGIWFADFEIPIPLDLPEDEQIKRYYEHGVINECNDVFAKTYGFDNRDEIIGLRICDLHGGSTKPKNYQSPIDFIRNGYRVTDLESHELDKHGNQLIIMNNSVGIIRDNYLTGIWGTQRDVTEQRKVEDEIRMLAQAVRNIGEGVNVTDLNENIIFVNDAFLKNYGYKRHEIIGQHISVIQSDNNHPGIFDDILEKSLSGGWRGELVNKRKDGSEFTIALYTSPILDSEGRKVASVGIARDITEQKTLEEQLRQSQKMESIGTLAGGIAHDFNNLLTVINGHTELARMVTSENHPLGKNLEAIHEAGLRATNLTRQLLAFSRKQVFEPEILCINEVIINLNKMIHRLIGEDFNIEVNLQDKISSINADPGQIEQIIINLLVNARDAINERTDSASGKRISIETREVLLDNEFVRTHAGSRKGTFVMISVSDSGIGMTAEIKDKIFEPFYTTKAKGKGTGLGLATVYGIVKQNNACIYVDSQAGKGSAFNIYWPLVKARGKQSKNEPPLQIDLNGNETILLVEDDLPVRNFAMAALKEFGYNVLIAGDGIEALEIYRSRNQEVDLMITDLIMPRMNGSELAEKIYELYPRAKILFASGYTDDQIAKSGALDKNVNFINKPYTAQLLITKIKELLSLE